MTEMNFLDRADIAGTRITTDGYMVGQVRCARTGCQTYMAADIGLPGSGTVSVYRPPEVVFDKASLATFAGKPVTLGHPTEQVTADNWRTYAVGDIGTDIARDGEFVAVPYKIMDATAIKAVQSGEARQISMGYTTGVELRDGVAPDGTPYQAVQTGPIRINHLAIVPAARGGANLRIGDGADNWGASPINPRKDADIMADAITTRTVMIDGLSVVTTDAGAQALEKLQKDAAAAQAVADKAIATKDAELASKDAEITALKAKVLDATALDALVKDRAAVIAKATAIADGVVTDGKSLTEIKRAAVVAKSGAEMADKSDAYIDAAFDILAKDAKPADPAAKALSDAAKKGAPDSRDTIYADRAKSLSDAWKPQSKKEAV